MELLGSPISLNVSVPKTVSAALDIKNNYYVVKEGLMYNYFPIKVEKGGASSQIIRFVKSPPVIREGIAIVNKELYAVPIKDLLRGIIRVSRKITVAKGEVENGKCKPVGNVGTAASGVDCTEGQTERAKDTSGGDFSEALQHSDKPGTCEEVELEKRAASDNAWFEQVESLLGIIAEKEGAPWEISDFA